MQIKNLYTISILFFLYIPNSHALVCQKKIYGILSDMTTISEVISIPNSLPYGTILWRQPTQTINVECWVDFPNMPAEKIYFYMNPSNENLGPDIDVGVTFQGRDYLNSSLPGGKLDIGWTVNGCTDNCGWQKESKYMTYSIFFIKKSPAGDDKEGQISKLSDYRAFQFDGVGGVRPGKSYNLIVQGMDKFKYLPCTSTISILPNIIHFGSIRTSDAKIGNTINEIPFTINEQRNCNAAYALSGYLEPLNATLSASNDTLIPDNNKSVGISIINDDSQKEVLFRKEFVLTPKTTSTNNFHQFTARLKWMTSTPTPGAFSAGAIVNVYYK